MAIIPRILIGAVALFFLVSGLQFWFVQDQVTPMFAIQTDNILGRTSIRADFGGFFLAVGLMSAMAAWKQNRAYAWGAMILLGLALTGRIISLLLDGAAPGGTLPMVVEAACIAALAWGRKVWQTPA